MHEVRLDRLATLYLFHPLRRFLWSGTAGIPILMYHSISAGPEPGRLGYFRTCTDPRVFRRQIEFLAGNGYQTISLNEAVRMLDGRVPNEGNFVVLTFDDGYRDFYTEAFPILCSFGYSATVYLPTAYIGESAGTFKGKPCLTWSEVRELRRSGVEFGSHTVTHQQLAMLPITEVRQEIRVSKDAIEERIGEPVNSFSYPYAFPETDRPFLHWLRKLLAESGYDHGVSTMIGTAGPSSDHFCLERLPVSSADDVGFLHTKLRGGYNWLHPLQLAFKLGKSPLPQHRGHLSNSTHFNG